ncbi:MAG: B12-binding domain-containing protein [Actinomycetota bacterium]
MDAETLALPQAAAKLGVHYQTAYKWVRAGDLPAVVVGGSYRLRAADVDRFAARRAEGSPTPTRRPRGGFPHLSERCLDMMHEGDERGVRALVRDLIDGGVPITTVLQEVLAPTLRSIGDAWHRGEISIATEHRATAIVERVIGDHHPAPRGRRRGVAVVAGPAGDRHSLPTAMAAAALRENNWHVEHLGADLPADELVRFCDDHQVDLVVVSGAGIEGAEGLADIERAFTGRGEPLLVGRAGDTLADLQDRAREAA